MNNTIPLVNLIWGVAVTIVGMLIYAVIRLTKIATRQESLQDLMIRFTDAFEKRVRYLEENHWKGNGNDSSNNRSLQRFHHRCDHGNSNRCCRYHPRTQKQGNEQWKLACC